MVLAGNNHKEPGRAPAGQANHIGAHGFRLRVAVQLLAGQPTPLVAYGLRLDGGSRYTGQPPDLRCYPGRVMEDGDLVLGGAQIARLARCPRSTPEIMTIRTCGWCCRTHRARPNPFGSPGM